MHADVQCCHLTRFARATGARPICLIRESTSWSTNMEKTELHPEDFPLMLDGNALVT